jgi:hypothetical protein
VGFIGGTGREGVCCPLFGLRAAEEKETDNQVVADTKEEAAMG